MQKFVNGLGRVMKQLLIAIYFYSYYFIKKFFTYSISLNILLKLSFVRTVLKNIVELKH